METNDECYAIIPSDDVGEIAKHFLNTQKWGGLTKVMYDVRIRPEDGR